jgi:hypothetical protein
MKFSGLTMESRFTDQEVYSDLFMKSLIMGDHESFSDLTMASGITDLEVFSDLFIMSFIMDQENFF